MKAGLDDVCRQLTEVQDWGRKKGFGSWGYEP